MIARLLTATALLAGTLSPVLAQAPASSPPVPAEFMANISPEMLAKMAPLPRVIPAPADPNAIPLYGARTPGSATTEIWSKQGDNVGVRNVSRPTLTPFLPDPAKATGAAVIVAPGGGFTSLSMELEGFQVARTLANRGVAAFVLKYRLVQTPADESEARAFSVKRIVNAVAAGDGGRSLQNAESTEDGLAALKMVRANAVKWGIDPARVGMIGFSAGAMTSLTSALAPQPEARPSFIGFIYGPQNLVAVPADAPPLFDAIALDDQIFPSMGFPIVEAWHKAKRPVELHAYGSGGHGFGLGAPGTTPTLMIDEFIAWLEMVGLLKPALHH